MLQPGDILLWRVDPSASWIDRLIGWGEHRLGQSSGQPYDYYHVGFVSADPRAFYQAKPLRLCLSPVPDPFPAYLEAYRLIVAPDPAGWKAVFGFADTRVGKLYDFLGVLTGGFFEAGGLEFCSKFTNDAFSYAGVTLCPYEQLISPDDIACSPKIARVII